MAAYCWFGRVRHSGVGFAGVLKLTISGVGARGAGNQRFAQIDLAATGLVDIIQVIEVNPMRAAVAQFHNRVLGHLLLQRKAPELGLRHVDAGVRHAQFNRWKEAAGPGNPSGPRLLLVTRVVQLVSPGAQLALTTALAGGLKLAL